ncbi:hypothetical protein [Sinomonas atrocyanea]
MRTEQACGIRQQGYQIPGCGSGPLQRWGFALRELRQALRDRKHRKGTAAGKGTPADGREPR